MVDGLTLEERANQDPETRAVLSHLGAAKASERGERGRKGSNRGLSYPSLPCPEFQGGEVG